jgi:uncharacterized membrane protein YbhN (UPF0104 family)
VTSERVSAVRRTIKAALPWLKSSVTFGLLTLIVMHVHWNDVLQALRKPDLWMLVVVLVAMVMNVFISAYKWQMLLKIHGVRIPYRELYRYYFAGVFFNNFLPSTIGGDGYRVIKTIPYAGNKNSPVMAVLAERITGAIALVLLGAVGGAVSYAMSGAQISQLAMVGGSVIFAGLVLAAVVLVRNQRATRRLERNRPLRFFGGLLAHLGDYRRQPGRTITVMLVSVGYQLFLLAYRSLLVFAVARGMSIFDLAVVLSISTFVALIPISINGYGLLDGSMIFLLVKYGLGFNEAVVVMILTRALNLPLTLLGGLIYLSDAQGPRISQSAP